MPIEIIVIKILQQLSFHIFKPSWIYLKQRKLPDETWAETIYTK